MGKKYRKVETPLRYHLNKHNEPARCRAKERPCPKPGEHYGSEAEAYSASLQASILVTVSTSSTPIDPTVNPRAQARIWHATQAQMFLEAAHLGTSHTGFWAGYQEALTGEPTNHPNQQAVDAGYDAAQYLLQEGSIWVEQETYLEARDQDGELIPETAQTVSTARFLYNPYQKGHVITNPAGEEVIIVASRQGQAGEDDQNNQIILTPPTVTWRVKNSRRHHTSPVTPTLLTHTGHGMFLHYEREAGSILDS